jgi:glutaredoxin-like protein
MATLLNEDIKKQVRDVFADLKNPVNILFFGQEENCHHCDDTRQLMEELAELSDKLQLTEYDLDKDSEVALQYNVDKAPGLVLAAQDGDEIIDFGIRYAGIPSGHEFSTLIHDLIQIASRDSGLNEKTRNYLKTLSEPLHLQVFVTPT